MIANKEMLFYAPSLTFMLVYIWSKRNPGMQIRYVTAVLRAFKHCAINRYRITGTLWSVPLCTSCSLLGLIAFTAPYLPWALLGFSLLLGQDITSDVIGIAVGHLYYYLADVYPALAAARGWRIKKLMYTPWIL